MLRSMYAGVSGLNSHQQMMDVTGNNISNVNTVGFKSSRVTFKEMLSQTIQGASAPQENRAGTNPQQVGLGVGIGSIDSDMSSGNLQSTGKTSDVAIQGDGFFVLRDGSTDVYSRAGNFNFDEQGRLYSSSTGMLVRGWTANANGDYNDFNSQNIGDITLKQEINAQETDRVRFGKNIDRSIMNKLEITGEQDLGNGYSVNIEESDTFNEWNITITDGINSKTKELTLDEEGNINNSSPTFEIDTNGDGKNEIYAFDNTNGLNLTKTITKLKDIESMDDGDPKELDLGNNYKLNILKSNITSPQWEVKLSSENNIIKELTLDKDGNIKEGGVSSLPFKIDTNDDGVNEIYDFDSTNGLTLTKTSTESNLEYSKDAARNISVDVFDSQGEKHSVEMQLEKVANNEWGIDSLSVDGIKDNSLDFDSDHVIEFGPEGNIANGESFDLSFRPAGTEVEQNVELDFSSMTQFAGDMTANFINANGYAAGALNSFSFTETGDVVGSYSNGLTQTLAKLGLANFSNPSGLSRQEGVFQATSNSGEADLGAPAQGGFGSLAPATLEMSNANLSQEFTNMITAQRGFQASSKLITTSDEMLQELVNLKR